MSNRLKCIHRLVIKLEHLIFCFFTIEHRTSNIVPQITTCSVSLTSTLQLPATYGHCTMYILHILVVIACTALPRIFNSCATRESHLTILLRLAFIDKFLKSF